MAKITFHNAPSFYVAYMDNWLAHKRAEKGNAAEVAIVEDLKKLVEVAVSVLAPIPAGKNKPSKP